MSILYYIANYFTNEGINEAVIYHLQYGLNGAGFQEYIFLTFSVIMMFVISFIFLYLYYRVLKNYSHPKPKYFGVVISKVFLIIAISTHPTALAIYQLFSKSSEQKTTLTKQCKASFNDYLKTPVITKNEKQYNLVYIYVESLERSYFNKKLFSGLTKKLQQLDKEAISFTDIEQVYGTGWTIAGMLASQCGLPLVTPSGGNSMSGTKMFYSEAICIGDILKKEGYFLSFMQGSSVEFAGIESFYKTHGFDEVVGKEHLIRELEDKSYVNAWGLYDDSFFDIAYEKYKNLSQTKQHFALYMATMDTHHPNGHMSRECQNLNLIDTGNPILNAVNCSSDMIVNFVKRIQNLPMSKNTIIVIGSDHLAMKNTATDILQKVQTRNDLFLIITPKKLHKKVSKVGSTLDIGPTVLNFLGFKIDELNLGRNLMNKNSLLSSVKGFNSCLESWQDEISKFWNFGTLANDIKIVIDKKVVNINDKNYSFPLLLKIDKNIEITPYFQFDSPQKLFTYLSEFKIDDFFIWVDQCRNINVLNNADLKTEYCYSMGYLGGEMRTFPLERDTVIKLDEIELLKNRFLSNKTKYLQNRKALQALKPSYMENLFQRVNNKVKKIWKKLKSFLKSIYTKFLEKWNEVPASQKNQIIKENLKVYKTDDKYKNRFIAHAGGTIEGYKYTDSLDALNNSYKKGFRVFELDIIKTSDNIFVAAHDWKHWAKITFYKGTLPPTLDKFNKHKIYGKFNPLDMQKINQWFKTHQDSILVTDKVNEPKEFAKKFIDKKRLMMELFTWESVEKAVNEGIKSVLLTERLLLNFEGNVVEKLQNLKVNGVAASYKILYLHPNLVKKLYENKIKLYIFHINYEAQKDEKYFICNKLNMIYGLYADKWDFNASLNCHKYINNRGGALINE